MLRGVEEREQNCFKLRPIVRFRGQQHLEEEDAELLNAEVEYSFSTEIWIQAIQHT